MLPLASALDLLRSPEARQKNDRSVLAELDARRSEERLPPGLEVEWLGTASFRLSHAGFDLLVDPYVTRPSLLQTLSRRPLRSSVDVVRAHHPRAGAVVVGHTHFDHALDVPTLSAMHACPVLGSPSLVALMELHGLGDRAVTVVPGRVYELGPFQVTFVESIHSKLLLGFKVPFEGELTCDHLDGLHGSAYRCGQTYGIHIAVAGVTFYHQGSADLLDDRVVHRGVDYFLCGIAGRGFTPRYVARALSKLEPRVVIPHHFDDFFRPLDAPLAFSLNVNLGGFVEEVRRVSGDFTILTLERLRPFAG